MKNIIKGFILIFSVALSATSYGQVINTADSTGLAGDNFSLQGAMELFKKAKSPEAFETALNNEKNSVNNLDLNEDGRTDFIKVKDLGESKSRVFVLQVDLNARETQDVAVITIEKTAEETAMIQIKGAEELYGEDKLYEPLEEKVKGGKGGPDAVMETYFVWVNVWYWPCVQYVYAPAYVYWYSPWYWDYYPSWWSPWYVRPWRVYYNSCYHYRPYCHQVYEYRNYDAYALYGPRKNTANSVYNRYEKSNYKSNQDNRSNKQQVVGRERVKQYESKSDGRTSKGVKSAEPTRGKAIETTTPVRENATARDKERMSNSKEINNGRATSPTSKPVDVNQGRERKQEKVSQPQSRPLSNSGNKERVSAPSKSSEPSKTPSVGRTSPQPSKGGKASPQRSAPSQRPTPAPSRSNSGGNSNRRK